MSAVLATDLNTISQLLNAPYSTWSSAKLLAYFKTRSHVNYFAIGDEAQVTPEKIAGILENRFDFNEEVFQFQGEPDWLNNPSSDIEWAIMLHKFYYAVGLGLTYQQTGDSRYVDKWQALTASWIHNVPMDYLSSDVTGRRIQNWIFAHYYFVNVGSQAAINPEFYQKFLQSLHQQTSHLCAHLTPARNHRTLELYTLFLVAVVFPEFKDAAYWLQFATDELVKNSQSDILEDGVHCELSTDYHHIVLRNFLAVKRLAVLNGLPLPEALDSQIKKALLFSVHAHKPDGFIPSLSDGDTGSFLNLLAQGYELYGDETFRYVATAGKAGTPPHERCQAFHAGGYYTMRSGWGDNAESFANERYLIFDCGPVGAGNHGHLDLLNIEMAAYGQSLVVDPGRYTYDESGNINWRVLFRGTRYHNTVVVDGMNQTQYEFHKQKFKITGQHPDFQLKAFVSRPGFDYAHGVAISHEYPVCHERKIMFIEGTYWLICDRLIADDSHNYELLFHLSALANNRVDVSQNQHGLVVASPHLLIAQPSNQSVTVDVEPGFISPTYGVKQAAPVINFKQHAASCSFYTVLLPYAEEKPLLSIKEIAVSSVEHICATHIANCLEIAINTNGISQTHRIIMAHTPGGYWLNDAAVNCAVRLEKLMGNGLNESSELAYYDA